jgi:hypothetical protein
MMYDCDLHYIDDALPNMTSSLCDSSDYYTQTYLPNIGFLT